MYTYIRTCIHVRRSSSGSLCTLVCAYAYHHHLYYYYYYYYYYYSYYYCYYYYYYYAYTSVGQAVVLENVGEELDATLNPILSRSLVVRGGQQILQVRERQSERETER